MPHHPNGSSAARPRSTPAKECSEAETHLTETVIPPGENRRTGGLKMAHTALVLVNRFNAVWAAMQNHIPHAYLYRNRFEEE